MPGSGRLPIYVLLGIAGLATSVASGIALGEFAVSGLDPTKAAAFQPGGDYAQLADSASPSQWMPAADSGMTSSVAYFQGDGSVLDQPVTRD